jgi:hypothetical protein
MLTKERTANDCNGVHWRRRLQKPDEPSLVGKRASKLSLECLLQNVLIQTQVGNHLLHAGIFIAETTQLA